jgi:CheY-like chemotaxis protein
MARILVIEDDKTHRRIIREILQSQGHETTEAEDGAQGIRLQQDAGYDLIITDILMPEMEGIETVRELIRLNPATKIIAITAYQEGYLEAAKKFGAMAALEKPFQPNELLEVVNNCLEGGS